LALPAYTAVIVLVPALVEVNVQVPAVTVPTHVADPSLTVTLPLGVPLPGPTGATAKLTAYDWPTTVAVLSADAFVIVVVVAAGSTVRAAVPALAWKKLVPP